MVQRHNKATVGVSRCIPSSMQIWCGLTPIFMSSEETCVSLSANFRSLQHIHGVVFCVYSIMLCRQSRMARRWRFWRIQRALVATRSSFVVAAYYEVFGSIPRKGFDCIRKVAAFEIFDYYIKTVLQDHTSSLKYNMCGQNHHWQQISRYIHRSSCRSAWCSPSLELAVKRNINAVGHAGELTVHFVPHVQS